jgi:hypothetical protein
MKWLSRFLMLVFVAVIALTVVAVRPLYAQQFGQPRGDVSYGEEDRPRAMISQRFDPRMLFMRMQQLRLSTSQKDRIAAIADATAMEVNPIRNIAEERETELIEQLVDENIDLPNAQARMQAIGVMREQITARWLDAYVSAWKLLDDGQRSRLRELAKEPYMPETNRRPGMDQRRGTRRGGTRPDEVRPGKGW